MQVMFKVSSSPLRLSDRRVLTLSRFSLTLSSGNQIGSSGRPAFPPDITPAAEDFLNKTFILDHVERPSAAELLDHAFITEILD